MNPRTRLALSILAAGLLSGCNMVVTDTPMFSRADAGHPPPIRTGVWRTEKPDCAFDEALPQDQWPKCAEASPTIGDQAIWIEVAGDPNLLQTPLPMPTPTGRKNYYFYIAFRPLKLDALGRIVEMKTWPVLCGPPPPPDSIGKLANLVTHTSGSVPASPAVGSGSAGVFSPTDPDSLQPINPGSGKAATASGSTDAAAVAPAPTAPPTPGTVSEGADLAKSLSTFAVTRRPLPGMVMNEMGDCAPDSVGALRDAARASEAWADKHSNSHWVRNRKPGDKPPMSMSDLTNLHVTQ